MTRNFMESLVAVLTGNALYFLLMSQLPEQIRHNPPRMDLGLLVDFCLCLTILGCIRVLDIAPPSAAVARPNVRSSSAG